LKPEAIIGVIPARYDSQRLPAKALIDLMGKPMVQRVYEQASRARLLNRVVVATDDKRIEKAVQGFGGEVVMTSRDIRSGSDRVAAVARSLQGDVFVNIQGDEPLIQPEMIDEAIQALLKDDEAVVSTLARRIRSADELHNPAVVKVVFDRKFHAMYFSRSVIPHVRNQPDISKWPEEAALFKHVGIYVFRREFLLTYSTMERSALEQAENLEQLRIVEAGETIAVGRTERDSIPVDTEEDVKRVLEILKNPTPQTKLLKDL